MATRKPRPRKTTAPAGSRGKATSASRRVARPSSEPAPPIELPEGMWERIAKKAYELWEQRGRREGQDLQDWFDAEAVVMEEIHEARE